MLTKSQIEKFYLDVESLKLKRPVARISEVVSISKGVVSEILNKKREPSENFYKKFYELFDQLAEYGTSDIKKAHSITMNELSGVILRTYALQQVSLSVLAELLAEKTGASVTATQSELLKAVEAEEVKMREVLRELQ